MVLGVGHILHGLVVVGSLEFCADGLAPVDDGAVALRADAHERSKNNFARIGPQHAGAFYDVELERTKMLFVVR